MRQNFHLLVLFSGFMDTESLQRFCNLTPTRQMDKQLLQTLCVCLLFLQEICCLETQHCALPSKELELEKYYPKKLFNSLSIFLLEFFVAKLISTKLWRSFHSQLPLHHNTKDYNPALTASFYKRINCQIFLFPGLRADRLRV